MNTQLLSSSSIVGTDVQNVSKESLGDIKDLMIDTSNGKIEYAVLSFGGFLGLGDKYFAIPWKAFTVDRVDEKFVLNITKDRLKEAPGFDKDNWPDRASNYYNTVRDFYAVTV